jgi:DNA sulfur modification protein DndD
MALHRYRDKVSDRLEMESEREKWDTIRMGTELKLQDVVSKALPEPYYHDPLLCDLTIESWENLRNRFKSAIEGMYNPPPIKCADSFLLVFVNNKDRIKLSNKIEHPSQSISIIQHKANEVLTNDQIIRELKSENNMLQSNSENIKDVVKDLNDYNTLRNTAEMDLSHLRTKLEALIETETMLKSDIDSYREFVNQTKISKSLLNIADSSYNVFDKWLDQLRPMTVDKLINLTTKKFLDIADSRFKGGHIHIDAIKNSSTEVKPFFVNRSGKTELFENMSGFERRSFGIAYSLALTQLTNYRAPLVIDTPLGNADGEYRVRLLKALANADLDQIILLSHDQEITEDLHNEVLGERITSDDGTYFLVEYDESLNESTILPNHYFY